MLSPSTKIERTLLTLIMAGLVVAGCGTVPPKSAPDGYGKGDAGGQVRKRTAETASEVALDQVGVPYRYGGSSGSGFDCSGLVHYAYARAGIQVPRTTRGLWRRARPLSEQELRAGDVLFFKVEGKMSHVGLYLGDGQFVHAPSTGKQVSVARLDSAFYRRAFLRGGRL